MKKQYIIPQINIVVLDYSTHIMETSADKRSLVAHCNQASLLPRDISQETARPKSRDHST